MAGERGPRGCARLGADVLTVGKRVAKWLPTVLLLAKYARIRPAHGVESSVCAP